MKSEYEISKGNVEGWKKGFPFLNARCKEHLASCQRFLVKAVFDMGVFAYLKGYTTISKGNKIIEDIHRKSKEDLKRKNKEIKDLKKAIKHYGDNGIK